MKPGEIARLGVNERTGVWDKVTDGGRGAVTVTAAGRSYYEDNTF